MCDYPMFIKKYSRLSQTSMFKESATNFQCWFNSDVSFQLDIFLFNGDKKAIARYKTGFYRIFP